MVKFDLTNTEGEKKLIITSGGKMTSLIVHPPLMGKHASPWPTLEHIPKIKDWTVQDSKGGEHYLLSPSPATKPGDDRLFNTLGRRIISGETKWGPNLSISEKPRYVPKYWEWLEDVLGRNFVALRDSQLYDAVFAALFTYDKDVNILRAFCEAWCSETNSFHTSDGEISVTPWDLYVIGGLPIAGMIYDEVVPYPDELRTPDSVDDDTIPSSCRFLLSAFHTLSSNDKVTLNDWVEYWFKGELRHKKPRVQASSKISRPKYIGNPDGVINEVEGWSSNMLDVFAELGVPDNLRIEVYLAAFLSCWLCIFVFPDGSNLHIRPSTFKPASLMANGRRVCLAIPVLATIYKGLNVISNSPTPGLSKSCFPIHYLLAWMAQYFGTHYPLPQLLSDPKMSRFSGQGGARNYTDKAARDLIHLGHVISWNAVSFVKSRPQTLSPFPKERSLAIDRWGRFVTIRPCMLSLRRDDQFILEPYSPHRFSRQFGFCQTTPVVFDGANARFSNLQRGLRYWRLNVHDFPDTKAVIPPFSSRLKMNTTPKFTEWWKKVHGYYLFDGRDRILASIQRITVDAKVSSAPETHILQKSLMSSSVEAHVGTLRQPEKRPALPVDAEDSLSRSEQHHRRVRRKDIISGDGSLHPSTQVVTKEVSLSEFERRFLGDDVGDAEDSIEKISLGESAANVSQLLRGTNDDGSSGSVESIEGPNSLDQLKRGKGNHYVGECSSRPAKGLVLRVEVPSKNAHPTASVFGVVDDVGDCQREYLRLLWEKLVGKFSGCSLEHLSSLEDDVNKI